MEGKIANLALLGLFGFGMTTILLNLHNAGLIGLETMIFFFLLALGDATSSAIIKTVAGWEGILCGASAMHVGFKTVLQESMQP